MEKFARIQLRSFRSQEGFEAPANIGALPRCQPVTSRCNPVVPQSLEHDIQTAFLPPLFSSSIQLPMGVERCSCTSSQFAPRFSQIPVYLTSVSTFLLSFVFSEKCIVTVVQANIPWRFTRRSFPAVSFPDAILSKSAFWTPSWYSFQP